ncbi:hypothetical protein DAEQUDRAFT_324602 [Daedalea quercina L-15889]|uniref:Uncharacterized protein n=1 Tax=Daedalea quercina L-15889 TaxID=1314783 RepID=A0A165PTW0_9APHY|nr:hypothetical protein DAEQUDRAFT_324602 [Daedalea quercina L-15889]
MATHLPFSLHEGIQRLRVCGAASEGESAWKCQASDWTVIVYARFGTAYHPFMLTSRTTAHKFHRTGSKAWVLCFCQPMRPSRLIVQQATCRMTSRTQEPSRASRVPTCYYTEPDIPRYCSGLRPLVPYYSLSFYSRNAETVSGISLAIRASVV